jgi:hypothetical protein
MKNLLSRSFTALAMLAAFTAGPRVANADHRGTLGGLTHPALNINDAYAFVDPSDPSKVVLAMTVNGATVPGLNPTFSPEGLYQFKIDNTGDFVEDLVIQVVFSRPTGGVFFPTQGFTVIGPIKPPRRGAVTTLARTRDIPITGVVVNVPQLGAGPGGSGVPVDTFTSAANGMNVFCGVRDDAFNFDEIFVRKILQGTLAVPNPANTRSPGIDFYARLNCSTIAIEVPSALLTGTLVNNLSHKQLNIWATTSVSTTVIRSVRAPRRGAPVESRETDGRAFVQQDRAAQPALSTFVIDDEHRDAFSKGQPKDDAKFFTDSAAVMIKKFQLDPNSQAAMTALDHVLDISFPNVLRLDVTSTSGFPSENGRRPQDDVISYELGLLTVGAVTNEGILGSNGLIGGNDAPFLPGFPFFASPHVPTEPIPARN